jgi:hypothetical protein
MNDDFKLYRIRLNTKTDADVIEILENVPARLRSLFVVDAIRFAKRVILEAGIKINSCHIDSSLQQLSNLVPPSESDSPKKNLVEPHIENKEDKKETQKPVIMPKKLKSLINSQYQNYYLRRFFYVFRN